MLNLTEIATRIRQPELCQAKDIDSLRTLCETYPYSQVFPLLYLKTLSQTNDVRLDNELQKFAYRISDRAVLFDLLNHTVKKEIGIEETIKKVDTILPNDVQVLENKNTGKGKETKEENPIASSLPTLPQEEEQFQLEEINSVNEPNLSIKGVEEVVEHTEQTIVTDLPSLPDDILQSISIGSEVYSLEAEEAKIATQKEKEQLEQEELEKEKQKLIEALVQKKSFSEEKNTSPRSFSSWLKQNSSHVEQIEEKPNPEALIDRFIQKDPKISSAKEKLFEDRTDKNELFNPTKKAKESLDETQLPVSETLAKIFAAQGNYPKAIYAYEQLMLIFPEKKVFFASQIEDLNKKLNT